MQINETELVKKIKNSETAAFKILYENYYEELYRFTWRRTRDQENSLDIIQDVFSRIWQNRSSLDESQSIKSFLYRSVVNQSIDLLRKKSVRQHTPLELVVEPETDDDSEQIENRQALNLALEKLSDKQREVFTMRHIEGLKNKEIAEILGVTVKAVEKRMTIALKQLREFLVNFIILIFWII